MANKAIAYKISEPTYKLPGEGSRENYSEGTFREDNRAVQAGLIVEGGFGDLSADKAGSTPANFTAIIDPKAMGAVDKITKDNAPGGGDRRGAVKDAFDNAEELDHRPTEQTWTKI